jgi:putative oxidoreductase
MMTVYEKDTPRSWLSLTDRAAARARDPLILLARLFMGAIFVMDGWEKLNDIPRFVASAVNRGIPELLSYVAPFVEFLGGVLLITGLATRYTSLIIIVFITIASFSSHRYWEAAPAQYAGQFNNFWKNVAMTGGAILLFVTGAGRYAIDALLQRRA